MFWKQGLVAALGVFVPMLALAEPAPLQACMGDIKALCGSIQQDREHIRDCMKQHHAQLSIACKAAIADRMLGGSQLAGTPRN